MIVRVMMGVALASLSASAAFGQSVPQIAPAETSAFVSCLREKVSQAQKLRTTPERFQMIISGTCAAEERAMLEASEVDLMKIGTDATAVSYAERKAITAKTVRSIVDDTMKFRANLLGLYTQWYEETSLTPK